MKYKGYIIYITIARVISDFLVLYLCFLGAFWIRFHSALFQAPLGIPSLEEYIEAFFIGALIIVFIFKSFGLYNEKKIFKYSREVNLIIKAMSMGIIVLMALTFAHRGYSYSRLVVIFSWILGILGLSISRYVIGSIEPWLCKIRHEHKKVIIIGTGKSVRNLLYNIKRSPRWGYQVVGFLSKGESSQKEIDGVPILGDVSNFEEVLEKKRPDEVILAVTGLSHEEMINLIVKCEKRLVSFKLVPDMFEIITSRVDVFDIDGVSLLGIREFPLEYAWNRFLKRTFDIVGSTIGLVLSSPLYIILSPLVKLTSQGSIFYKQARCGEDGKNFALYKFRTMDKDAEQKTGPVWAKEDDPRCTWLGRWLRKFNIDELPQLVNVFRGDMSLVGPRPERPHFVENFKDDIPRYMSRHLIKSGITGWAQVNGLRGNTPLDERIKYDMYYIENWSLLFDIKILFMTLFIKKNAY